MLFVPFSELKNQGILRERCDNIGLGLSCSSQIVKAMNGDIALKQSARGLTNVAFKIPVKI
jgi:K+-sensing histidine kinase KdpD